MRIDRLELRNFKKFASFELDLHCQFTLLIGENGAGKTSILDAIAVALGVWLVEPPDSTLIKSRRGIYASEIRLESSQRGDRELFREAIGDVSYAFRQFHAPLEIYGELQTVLIVSVSSRTAHRLLTASSCNAS